MPQPWDPDATKDATLSALAAALQPDQILTTHSGTAWAMVRGQAGFPVDDTDGDNLLYVRYNWPRFAPE